MSDIAWDDAMTAVPVGEYQTGDKVLNVWDLPIEIVGVGDGYYIGAGGVEWVLNGDGKLTPYHPPAPSANGHEATPAAADLRPVVDSGILIFQVDVSRTYRNKDGYEVGGYKLNTSFVTETHTIESFFETVVKEGWPYTMVHAKLTPQETGAAARGVTTPKHTENFTSSHLLTFDDDSMTTGVIDFWLREPFFSRYGLAFVESVNSRPGESEKGHVTFLLDRPITDPDKYRECLKAFALAHPRLDPLTNIDRTIYNAQGARVLMVGAVCPVEEFERTYLSAYQAAEREKARAIEAEYERRQLEADHAKADRWAVSSSQEEAYLAGYLRWMFDHVAAKRAGDNRNKSIYWAGRCIAGIEATDWARPYLHLLADAEVRIASERGGGQWVSDRPCQRE